MMASSGEVRGRTGSPLVTVCIPTYNRPAYLREAIESVLRQTYVDFELRIYDNGSSPDTAGLIAAFGDDRIQYLRNHRNIGAAANWIRALTEADSRYCATLSDDDRWEPTLLESLLRPLERDSTIDVAFSDHHVIDQAGRLMPEMTDDFSSGYGRASLRPGLHRPFVALAVDRQSIPLSTALIRHDRLMASGALSVRSGTIIDYYLFARLSLALGGAYYVPERLASIRVHRGSASSTGASQIWRDMQWACRDIHGRVSRPADSAPIRRKWAAAVVNEAVALNREGHHRELAGAVARAVMAVPPRARLQVGVMAARDGASRVLRKVFAWTDASGRGPC